MSQGRRHVQTYLGLAEYGRLQREAAARGATISKCAADCLREYFALRAELATALETAGEPGDPHHGTIIHSILARSEERLVATRDARAAELREELRSVKAMVDYLAFVYFCHTPQVPVEQREAALASGTRRHAHYRKAVAAVLAQPDPSVAGTDSVKE
jgi:hypothetical protein